MKRVSIYLLRDNLASYLNEVAKTGEIIVVEKYKKPIAVINPAKKSPAKKNFNKFFGFLGGGETGDQLVKRIRRSKKELKKVSLLRKGIAA